MSTDKTLADVQPGGRVRLVDQDEKTIEKLRAMMDHSFGGPGFVVYGTAQSIAEVERRLAPSLSAQPSPGGQDARAIIEEFIQCATLGRPHGKLIAQAKDYLAARQPVASNQLSGNSGELDVDGARQPVGEPLAWMTHHDEPMLFPTAAEAAAYCEDDEQPVPLFRSPAQAVDLEQFRRAVRWAAANAVTEDFKDYAEGLLALIDSKAVGNK